MRQKVTICTGTGVKVTCFWNISEELKASYLCPTTLHIKGCIKDQSIQNLRWILTFEQKGIVLGSIPFSQFVVLMCTTVKRTASSGHSFMSKSPIKFWVDYFFIHTLFMTFFNLFPHELGWSVCGVVGDKRDFQCQIIRLARVRIKFLHHFVLAETRHRISIVHFPTFFTKVEKISIIQSFCFTWLYSSRVTLPEIVHTPSSTCTEYTTALASQYHRPFCIFSPSSARSCPCPSWRRPTAGHFQSPFLPPRGCSPRPTAAGRSGWTLCRAC